MAVNCDTRGTSWCRRVSRIHSQLVTVVIRLYRWPGFAVGTVRRSRPDRWKSPASLEFDSLCESMCPQYKYFIGRGKK